MASWQHAPEFGDKFWQEGVGSGKITYVDYQGKEVYVTFYEKGQRTYAFDDIFGCWSEDFGGTYMIYNI